MLPALAFASLEVGVWERMTSVPRLTPICWVLTAISFHPYITFVQPSGSYPYTMPSEPSDFHPFAAKQKHVAHSSPHPFWHLLKLIPEGNALLFVNVCCSSAGTYELRAYLMVQVKPLVSKVLESLYTMPNASKRLPFIPWWL